jgi:hypothetical protein
MTVPPAHSVDDDGSLWIKKLLVAAALSVALGLFVQAVVMLAVQKWPANPLAETAQKITWSTVVCSALAIGTSLRKALPGVVGLLGLVTAPAAFFAAKATQKALSAGASAAGPAVPDALETAAVKGVQYLVFGVLIVLVASKRGWKSHAAVGLLVGALGAVWIHYRLVTANDPAPASPVLLARALNEVVFPLGCALVLWIAGRLGAAARARTTA